MLVIITLSSGCTITKKPKCSEDLTRPISSCMSISSLPNPAPCEVKIGKKGSKVYECISRQKVIELIEGDPTAVEMGIPTTLTIH